MKKNISIFLLVILHLFFIDCHVNGEESTFTSQEKKAIIQLRMLSADAIGEADKFRAADEHLIRFLRDSDLNVSKANEKLRKYLQYRKEQRLDDVLKEDFSDIRKWCNFEVEGHDIEGRPLLLWPLGTCDLRRIVLAGKQDRLDRYIEFLTETTAVAVRNSKTKSGKVVGEAVGIMDLNGFSLRQQGCLACLPFYTSLIQKLDSNYPQALKSFNIINTPKSFHRILEQVANVASSGTKRVIHIYGVDKGEWSQAILKTIRKDQLPQYLGGTRKTDSI